MSIELKQRIAFSMVMGLLTTGIISFTLLGINTGFGVSFVANWLRSWATAYVVVIPMILVVGPRLQRLVGSIVKA